MKDLDKNGVRPIRPLYYMGLLTFVWTLAISISLGWNLYQHNLNTLEMARTQAQVSYDKDLTYRSWSAGHGGVYVPVTDKTPPNPYLDIPERTITTPSGRLLTLMNPAYMTRQLYEQVQKQKGVLGHITSLNPIRPENTPDLWETEALTAFRQGETEVSSIAEIEGKSYMRLMRPLVTEKNCLKCHASQGFQVGDIRGGISVSVPMEPLWAIAQKHTRTLWWGHFLLWSLGLGALSLGVRNLRQRVIEGKKAEEKVKQTKDYLGNIIESSLDCIVISDATGNITRANKSFLNLIECEEEEIIGKHIAEFSPPREGTYLSTTGKITEINEKFFEEAQEIISRMFEEEKISNWNTLLIRKDGKVVPVEENIVFLKNEKGDMSGVLGVIRDITDRKRMEEELELAHGRVRNILDSASQISIITTDPDGLITVFNTGAERMLGYTADEMVDKQTPIAIHLESEVIAYGEELTAEYGRPVEGFEVFVLKSREVGYEEREWTYVKKDGAPIQVNLGVTAIRDSAGEITGFLGVATDITGRKEDQYELQKTMEEMQRFNKLMAGREMRVIEMKKKVNALLSELGRQPQYRSAVEGEKE